jgi:hypothetical protein
VKNRIEAERTEKGEVHIWLEERWLDKLKAMRGPGESYSDLILRLAAVGQRALTRCLHSLLPRPPWCCVVVQP